MESKQAGKKLPTSTTTKLRWVALSLITAGHDGEAAYNSESASIERYGNGFLLIAKGDGAQFWYPDAQVRNAQWQLEE